MMVQRLVWHCTQGTSRKFYSLSVERDLWGDRAIVRRWGRLDGTRVQVIVDWDPSKPLDQVAQDLHRRRLTHGYELVDRPDDDD